MDIKLGPYNPQAPSRVTPNGITYFPYGLDDYGPKKVKRAVKDMRAAGVAEWIINQFAVQTETGWQGWAVDLPTMLPVWLDSAFAARMTDWRACVGKRLPNGNMITASGLDKITPASIPITFRPGPFIGPHGVQTWGLAYTDHIEVVMYDLTDNNWLRQGDKLAGWEDGNCFGRRFGYFPDPNNEIGDRSPCVL